MATRLTEQHLGTTTSLAYDDKSYYTLLTFISYKGTLIPGIFVERMTTNDSLYILGDSIEDGVNRYLDEELLSTSILVISYPRSQVLYLQVKLTFFFEN